jgi:hypothetical protein
MEVDQVDVVTKQHDAVDFEAGAEVYLVARAFLARLASRLDHAQWVAGAVLLVFAAQRFARKEAPACSRKS